MRTIATTITKILNPFLTSLAAIVVVISVQQMSAGQKILWVTLGVLVAAVPTVVFLVHAVVADRAVAGTDENWWHKLRAIYFGNTSSFWSPEGRERVKSFWAWVGIAFIYAVAAYLAGAPRLVTALAIVLLVLGVINLIAASSFKISVHCELVTLLVLVAILAVSVDLIYLAVLILLVAWARVYLKAHSLSEVTFGVFASLVVVYVVFTFFGLLTL